MNEDDNWRFRRECYLIELITRKKWQNVFETYSLPELIRLQGAMMIFDMI